MSYPGTSRIIRPILASAFALFLAGCAGGSDIAPADYIFEGGTIYTVDAANPSAEAVAVRGERIVYVGDPVGAEALRGPDTEVVDLAGRMLLPGFIDNHIHSFGGALIARGVDLLTDDRDEILRRVREYAEANPDLPVILGYGWRLHLYPDPGPRKEVLDEIDSERPIFLWAVDGHSAWVNSRALEVAGVDADFPDTQPPFSYYQRDPDGSPTGWVVEIPAQFEVLGHLVDMDEEYITAGLVDWFPRFSAAGVTALFDAGIQGVSNEDGYRILTELERSGELPFRVFAGRYWNNADEDPLPDLQALSAEFNSPLVKVTKLKVNADGGDDKHNAFYLEPYADRPDWRGEPLAPAEVFTRRVVEADAAGFDTFCHCYGDGAARMYIDAVETAIQENPPRDRRHTISHALLVDEADIPRLAELGITTDMTLTWAARDPLITGLSVQRLGPDRAEGQFQAREVIDAGGRLSLGSDWPVAGYAPYYEPLRNIQGAVTRQMLTEPRGEPLGGAEARLTLEEAILAATLNAAYSLGVDDEIGSIALGKLADLVVLERNLFDVEIHAIGDVGVDVTMMNGKLTHSSER